ncbi:MAG: lysylphosphatidylglycerol synthase transmembrane domain-containing protein [Leptospiraceae bacterium]|nr:lysylphosphatidylglycerol synthase transmembrane domain-containing protein [Leptospiraceae bacterium]
MRKFLIGILISSIFIGVLAYKFDYNEFSKLWSKINYSYLALAYFSQLLGVVLFSVRWYYLLGGELKFKHCISSSFIGYGANMVLPARGGDLFRVYYCRQESGLQFLSVLSKLFIEKVIDFLYVILTGIISYMLLRMGNQNAGSFTIFTVSGTIVIGILVSLYLLRFKLEWILKLLVQIASKIGKEKFYKDHVEANLIELSEFLKFKNFTKPLLMTVITWFAYISTYLIISYMLEIKISVQELVFILFCGAMSLAVPSAPSGIGVFHASVISAFLLLGKDENDGLVFATAIHLISFIALTTSGLVFYLFWTYRRRHAGKPLIE